MVKLAIICIPKLRAPEEANTFYFQLNQLALPSSYIGFLCPFGH